VSEFELSVANYSDLDRASRSYASGQLHETHRLLQQHLAQEPDCGQGWEMLGLVCHAWRHWGPSLAALEEASVRVPMSPAAECAMADCYLAVGRHKWAESFYCQLLRRKHVPVQVLLSAATGLDLLSQPQMAAVACRRAIRLQPEAAQSYFALSYYLGRCGAPFEQRVALARQAIDLEPDNLTFRVGLAGFLHYHEHTAEGVQLLAEFSHEQIVQMHCRGCLGRLIDLFEAIDDNERVNWCRQQRDQLQLNGLAKEC
jgi:tetratricopeptide (TPR) repeat protein